LEENICKFVSSRRAGEELHIIHFVYEKTACFPQTFLLPATYTAAFVNAGEGRLHTPEGIHPLKAGDVFLLFAAKPYFIENTNGLQYMYISFTGTRASALMDRLRIPRQNPVYHHLGFLRLLWENAFDIATDANLDLLCEGILLYTLSNLCPTQTECESNERISGVLQVKQYVDLHFADSMLTLDAVSRTFAYNPRYLSTAFRRMMRISFTEYLTRRRLEYAVSLMKSGIENVRELSEQCGYRDPLYFSKVFRRWYGVSPKQYLLKMRI